MEGTTGTPPRAFLLLGQAGARQFHNQPEHWAWLASILRSADLGARVIVDDPAWLRADMLAMFDVLLNFSTDYEADETRMRALSEAVRGGIGYVGLHAATATFRGNATYHALVGSWFDRHPPIRSFTVEPTAPEHPVMAGIGTFEIEDERYELRDLLPDVEVLARAEGHPMVYVRQHGRGRVCYIAPGHDHRTLSRPEYAQLVHQAITWVARRPVAG